MNPEEKVEFVRNEIRDETYTHPSGSLRMGIYALGHPDNEEWTLITRSEKQSIIQKLQEEGFVKDVEFDEDGKWVTLEMLEKPKGSTMSPEDVAKVWILWNQIITIFNSYENNSQLDKNELERLYSELIQELELVIEKGNLWPLRRVYKRPFTSLRTANLEVRSKYSKEVVEFLDDFLVQITEHQLDQGEIRKNMGENYAQLIKRVTVATQALGIEKTSARDLSYEQALFLAKLLVEQLYQILSAACGGYILLTDEELNAVYLIVRDDLEKILQRDDFRGIVLPDGIPEHLYMVDEMDVWWGDANGRVDILRLTGDINSAWSRAGSNEFPVGKELFDMFGAIDNLVTRHRKRKAEDWARTEKRIKERAAEMSADFQPIEKDEGKTIEENPVANDNKVMLKVQGGDLTVNQLTGFAQLNEVKHNFNPKSQEFLFLVRLVTTSGNLVRYEQILEKVTKSSKRTFSFVVRNLKEGLGILPEEKAKNKDIIQSVKNVGYRLLT